MLGAGAIGGMGCFGRWPLSIMIYGCSRWLRGEEVKGKALRSGKKFTVGFLILS